jgi:phosphotriesterase-related protein
VTAQSDEKYVWGVNGAVPAATMGRTLCHEHLFASLAIWFRAPTTACGMAMVHRPVTMDLLGQLRRQPFETTLDNLVLGDIDQAIQEVTRFRMAGGRTIVDATPPALARDPFALRQLANATGVNVVMGCGYYVEDAHPDSLSGRSVDDIAAELIDELTNGVDGTDIRPGVIGEVGTSGVEKGSGRKTGHVSTEEERVLRACANAGIETQTAVSVHLDPRGEGAFDVVKILDAEGLPREQMILGHLDHLPSIEYQEQVADLGVYIEFDNFGREYYWDSEDVYWNNDWWRVHTLAHLIRRGHVDQILLSQDVSMKIDLRAFGGYGYDHVLVDIVPAFWRAGVTDIELDKMLVRNPARALCQRSLKDLGEETTSGESTLR